MMAEHRTYDATTGELLSSADTPNPTPDPTLDLAAEVASLNARVDGFAGLAVTLSIEAGVPPERVAEIIAEAAGGPTP